MKLTKYHTIGLMDFEMSAAT